MMQAAQLAAEAAMAEAAAQEAAGGQHQVHQGHMDMDASSGSLHHHMDDGDQMAFLKALQNAGMDQTNLLNEINMMGLNPNDHSVQSLLHMLAQQEQENQRPDEHYLTIAQNGKQQDCSLFVFNYDLGSCLTKSRSVF